MFALIVIVVLVVVIVSVIAGVYNRLVTTPVIDTRTLFRRSTSNSSAATI